MHTNENTMKNQWKTKEDSENKRTTNEKSKKTKETQYSWCFSYSKWNVFPQFLQLKPIFKGLKKN
jgi:hypothetical protein